MKKSAPGKQAILVAVLLAVVPCVAQEQHLRAPNQPIPKELFGLHIHHVVSGTPWPSVPFGVLRLWDTYLTWADIEKERGKYDFTVMDKVVSLAEEHGVEIEMPLGTPPPWASARPTEAPAFRPGSAAEPKNMQDYSDYVRTLATRYKGRIHNWELWNEPNMHAFYSGNVPKMEELGKTAFEILKQVDPSNRIAAPNAMGDIGVPWLRQFLAAGGGKYADAIGFHPYVAPKGPEQMVTLTQQVRAAMAANGMEDKTIWATEAGWYIHSDEHEVKPSGSFTVISADEAAGYVPRAYALLWAMGVTRFNWYDWDSAVMALADAGGKTLKPAGVAYGTTYKWLVGATMESCDGDRSSTWVCHIKREGGYNAFLVWNAQGTKNFAIPTEWNMQIAENLDGTSHSVRGARSIAIGIKPILLEDKAR